MAGPLNYSIRIIEANQCCGSGMFILDLGSWFLPIPDPGSRIQKQLQKRGVNKFLSNIFCSHKFHKMYNYFILNCSRKKTEPNFKELGNFLPKKLSLSSQKYEFGIPDPGSRSATLKLTLYNSHVGAYLKLPSIYLSKAHVFSSNIR